MAAGTIFRDLMMHHFSTFHAVGGTKGTLENQTLKYMYESSGQRRAGHGMA